jgi:hypothetical protein
MGGNDPLPLSSIRIPLYSLRYPERESDLNWGYLLITLLYKRLHLWVDDESCEIIV